MGARPVEVRRRFEAKMTSTDDAVTRRIGRFLVPRFEKAIVDSIQSGAPSRAVAARLALNHCSEILLACRSEVLADYRAA